MFRRKLHQYPELAFKEQHTQEFILRTFKKYGIKTKKIAGTGILAWIKQGRGKDVLIRADMDALPVQEKTGLSYSSEKQGIMHACGHDFNMSIIFGAALLLQKEFFKGEVYFLFQPAEEVGLGAEKVLKDKNWPKKIDYIFGVHIEPQLSVGSVGIKDGVLMANVDQFSILIKGQGGHAAYPHLCKNPIDIFPLLYYEWQKIISQKISPFTPAVLTVCRVEAGEKFNVVPESMRIEGTVRTLEEKVRKVIKREMENVVREVKKREKIEIEFYYRFLGESLTNHSKALKIVRKAAKRGKISIKEVKNPSMGGDDFSLFLKKYTGAYLYIGGKRKGKNYPWHSPYFHPEEKSIKAGCIFLKDLVKEILK